MKNKMRSFSVLPLFRRAIVDSWRSTLGWAIGLTAAIALYVPLFASIGGNKQMLNLLASLPKQLINALSYDQITTGAGYVQSTFFGLMGFALFTIAVTGWGTAAIAGDEESGSLELTLAHGVSRTQVVLERTLALAVRVVALALLCVVLIIALGPGAKLGIQPAHVVAEGLSLIALSLLPGTCGIAIGALTGRKVYATSAGAGIAIASYVLNAVANQSKDLDFLHAWSPLHWAYGTHPLAHGADWGGFALLLGLSTLFVAVALVALNRRDIAN